MLAMWSSLTVKPVFLVGCLIDKEWVLPNTLTKKRLGKGDQTEGHYNVKIKGPFVRARVWILIFKTTNNTYRARQNFPS